MFDDQDVISLMEALREWVDRDDPSLPLDVRKAMWILERVRADATRNDEE